MTRAARVILSVFLLLSWLSSASVSYAQSEAATGPVYIVQEGDSLWDIAYRFHVTQEDLAAANGIADADQITIGRQLIIPGLEGIQGVLTAENISYGETLRSLSLRYHISIDSLERLNHLTSPNELYAGYSLVIVQQDSPARLGRRASLQADQSLLEFAVLNNSDPWSVLTENLMDNSSKILPGDVLRVRGEPDPGPGGLPPSISSIVVSGLTQGETAEIQVTGEQGLSFTGSLIGHGLSFFEDPAAGYVALQGVHAMASPGLYPLVLEATPSSGDPYRFSQDVLISAGDFLYDRPLSVDPATLDPETTMPEDKLWMETASEVSAEKSWQGMFGLPVEPVFAECYPSRYGSRRSYNGSDYTYFHTGLDYCSQVGNPIYAAASGVVVFAGPLTVRGNATMIDHGHGIFSAYMHQSEILVNVGDRVEQGQLIGRVGNTGRAEGAHLHFEIIVGGVQVNPIDWLEHAYP